MVPSHQPGGTGNQFRAVTVGSPQSPMCGDWGEPKEFNTISEKSCGLVQMLKMGLVYIFVSELPESGLQGATKG